VVPQTGQAAPGRLNEWLILIGVAAAGAIAIGLVYWRTRAGRKAS